MLDAFLTVLVQVLIMVILIGIGVIITKKGKFSESTVSQMTWILFNIVTPCVIATSFITMDPGSISGSAMLTSVLTSFLCITVGILPTFLLFRKEGVEQKKVLRFCIIFSNTGYMGLPLVVAIIGAEGVIYASFYVAMFNFLNWTYGYFLMNGLGNFPIRKIFINPGTVGIAIGLPIYLLKIDLPDLLVTPIESLGLLNTPLAMMVLGSFIAKVKLKEFFTNKNVYIVTLFRLLIVPALAICILLLIRPDDNMFVSNIIQASAPAATSAVLFASMFKSDTKLTSATVSFTTIVSIITMPLVVSFTQYLVTII